MTCSTRPSYPGEVRRSEVKGTGLVIVVGRAELGLDDDHATVRVPRDEVQSHPAVPPTAAGAVDASHLLANHLLPAGDLQAGHPGAFRQQRRAGGEPAAEVARPQPQLPRVADGPVAGRPSTLKPILT